jgi:hypothetical protein
MKNYNLRAFFLLLSLFFPLTVLASDVRVVIKEKGSGLPIEGATVVLDEREPYGETDNAGRVIFSGIDTAERIKVLAPGYEVLVKTLGKDKTAVTVYLIPFAVEGEGLEVVAARLSENASKISLSKNELLNAPGTQGDPLKAITALPGIVPVDEGSAEIYMRGSNANENIVWINRAPVSYLYHFGGFQSVINPALIEDINVFLGGFPVEYGDALGGVIDVKLRAPKNDRMHYRFDISTISSAFLAEGPVNNEGKDSFFIAARRSYIDLLFSPNDFNDMFEDDEDEDPDQITLVPRFYDAQALYRHELEKGYVDYYFFAAGDEEKIELRSSAKSDPQLAGELRNKQEFQTLGTTWQQSWDNRRDHVMTLAYYHNKSNLNLGRDESGQPFFANVESGVLYWQPEFRWRLRADDQLSFGLTARYSDVPVDLYISRAPDENDPDFDFTSQRKYRLKKTLTVNTYTPYIKYRRQWTPKLMSIIGLRYSDIAINDDFRARELSPRATLEYELTPDILFTASWGRYVQVPQGTEIVEEFGNPGLQVTEAEHRILGVQHRINSLYSVKAEIYHKPMTNLVVSIDENDSPDNYANEGTGEAYGFDFFLKREPRGHKIGWLALSWARSRRTNELTGITRDFSGDQPLTLTAVWGQPFSGSWKHWDWGVKVQAHSGTPHTRIVARNREDSADPESRWIPEYGKHNGVRTPTYYKVDLRISRAVLFNTSKAKFYLDLQNVTFTNNVVDYNYGSEYEKIDNPTEVKGLGFFPFLGVEMEF